MHFIYVNWSHSSALYYYWGNMFGYDDSIIVVISSLCYWIAYSVHISSYKVDTNSRLHNWLKKQMWNIHCVRKKMHWQYFGNNFSRQIFITFHNYWHESSLQSMWLKNCKCPINTCTTLCNCEVIEKCCICKKRNARIHSAFTVASSF